MNSVRLSQRKEGHYEYFVTLNGARLPTEYVLEKVAPGVWVLEEKYSNEAIAKFSTIKEAENYLRGKRR